jgi:DNA-directed RNA polymerase subunit RPC12/RpoP
VKISCQTCNQNLDIPEELLGQEIECPACKAKIIVPAPSTPAPPPIPNTANQQDNSLPRTVSNPGKGLGIARMILGICSITIVPCLTPIPAIICGHKSRKKSKQSSTAPSGMALAGLITGYIGLIPFVVFSLYLLAAVAVPKNTQMRSGAAEALCLSQLKQIDTAKEMWATAEKKPNSAIPTRAQIGEYISGGFPTCPSGGKYNMRSVSQKATCSVHSPR